MEKKKMLNSFYTIRKIIGTLGVLLPILVVIGNKCQFLPSLSHYYYSQSAVFFIAILSSFGLFLISYKGYEKAENEWFSDNCITHMGGFAVLLVVVIPTACVGDECTLVGEFKNGFPMYGHTSSVKSAIHLASAGIFLFAMGWMSVKRFTKGTTTKYHTYYKYSGYTVWACISILLIEFVASKITGTNVYLSPFDVLFFETIAVAAFGSSWLLKGKAIKDIIGFKNAIVSKLQNN